MKRNFQSLWSPARVLPVFLSLGKQMCIAACPEGWQNRAVSDQGRWILNVRSRHGPRVEMWGLHGEPWGRTTSLPTRHAAGPTQAWEGVMPWNLLHPSPWAPRALHSITAQDRCLQGGQSLSPSSGTSLGTGWGTAPSVGQPYLRSPCGRAASVVRGSYSARWDSRSTQVEWGHFVSNKCCFPDRR